MIGHFERKLHDSIVDYGGYHEDLEELLKRAGSYGSLEDAIETIQKALEAVDDKNLPSIVRKTEQKKLESPIRASGYNVSLEDFEGKEYIAVKSKDIEFDLKTYGKIKETSENIGYSIHGGEDRITLAGMPEKKKGKITPSDATEIILLQDRMLISINIEAEKAKAVAENVYSPWPIADIQDPFRRPRRPRHGDIVFENHNLIDRWPNMDDIRRAMEEAKKIMDENAVEFYRKSKNGHDTTGPVSELSKTDVEQERRSKE